MSIANDMEAYEFVKNGMLNQDCRSDDMNGACRYRGGDWIQDGPDYHDKYFEANGKKCAVGFLISDEYYDQNFENDTIDAGGDVQKAIENSNPEWDLSEDSIKVLVGLQRIHDHYSVDSWLSTFDKVDDHIHNGNKDLALAFKAVTYADGIRS
jgi:hypothetical protein|tara:strand:- start:766 stop:1224 length:459 start_codon:yes stop_codon:yes gene_type:complete